MFVSAGTSPDSLLKYRVLIYAHPAIVSESTAALLALYVDRGGQLIVGCRSGLKEPTGHCRTGAGRAYPLVPHWSRLGNTAGDNLPRADQAG